MIDDIDDDDEQKETGAQKRRRRLKSEKARRKKHISETENEDEFDDIFKVIEQNMEQEGGDV